MFGLPPHIFWIGSHLSHTWIHTTAWKQTVWGNTHKILTHLQVPSFWWANIAWKKFTFKTNFKKVNWRKKSLWKVITLWRMSFGVKRSRSRKQCQQSWYHPKNVCSKQETWLSGRHPGLGIKINWKGWSCWERGRLMDKPKTICLRLFTLGKNVHFLVTACLK